MAHYIASIRSPLSPAEAFAYMADVRHFADWDPSITAINQVTGISSGLGATFDITVKAGLGITTLRYVTTIYDRPWRVQIEATTRNLVSVDRIDVVADGDGCIVTYDADLRLIGAARVCEPVLWVLFNRIGDRAASGLARALGGSKAAGVNTSTLIDAVVEAPIVTSFSNIGYHVRRRTAGWRPLESYALADHTIVVTGATSGLGAWTATCCARLGARVIVTGRDRDRVDRAAAATTAVGNGPPAIGLVADMGDLAQVRELAAQIAATNGGVDALVHNAGALSSTRTTNGDGIETTVASQVLGPFLLTHLLIDALGVAAPGRVITVSSGGMYTAPLTVETLEMSAVDYSGSEQYARAKRAQVTLNELWAERVPADQVVFHAMHPGWADTPGVRTALPTFRRITRPLLRSEAQGADTIVWLIAAAEPALSSGGFWLDRHLRPIHKLKRTRSSDTDELRRQLWDWCTDRAGLA